MTDEGIEESASTLINNVECIFFLTVIDCSWSAISAQEVMFYTARFKGYILMYSVVVFPELNGNVLVKQVNFRLENLTDALNKIIAKFLKDYSLFLVTEEYKIWLYIQLEKLVGIYTNVLSYPVTLLSVQKFLFYLESRKCEVRNIYFDSYFEGFISTSIKVIYSIITK